MTTSTPSKLADQDLLAKQHVAASTSVIGAAVDVSALFAAGVVIRFGRRAATAATGGARLRLEVSPKASGLHWVPIWEAVTDFAAVSDEAGSGTINATQPVFGVASTTGLVAGDHVFIANGTAANSEWQRILSIVTNTSVTFEDNLENAQTSTTLYDGAQTWAIALDLSGWQRMRLVVDAASGPFSQNYAVEARFAALDAVDTA